MWNDEFELPGSSFSVSDTQDYIKYIIKEHKTLPTDLHQYDYPPTYINRINNRLVFKIKDGNKLESLTLETMKLFGSTKKLIEKAKNG